MKSFLKPLIIFFVLIFSSMLKYGDEIGPKVIKFANDYLFGISESLLPKIVDSSGNRIDEQEICLQIPDRLYSLEKKHDGDRKKACSELLDEINKLPPKTRKFINRALRIYFSEDCFRIFVLRDYHKRFDARLYSNTSFTREEAYQEIVQLVSDLRFGGVPEGASNREVINLILYGNNTILEQLKLLTEGNLLLIDTREKILADIRKQIIDEAKKMGVKAPDEDKLYQKALDKYALEIQKKKIQRQAMH